MIRNCGGGDIAGMWVMSPEAVDMQMLIDAAYATARGRIPQPSLNMSPAPEFGSVVNVGLWLAVNDPGQVNAVAAIGPVWAAVTARFVATEWDMGDGSPSIRCDGLGVPYPQTNTFEQGPCGYTYRRATPEGSPYIVTVTGHWDVTLTTSDGRAEPLVPMAASHSFAYDVDEIVTVGEGS